jgi:serine protease Do
MGIGFAIPITMAQNIQEQLLKHGKVTRGWLGVVIQDVTDELAKSFGLENTRGVLISEVSDESPAGKAGLLQGDVIIKLNGTETKDVTALRNKIAMILPGTEVNIEFVREGKTKKLTVTIGEQPEDFGKAGFTDDGSLQKMGLTLQDLTPELAKQFNYDEDQGVLIADVEPESPADMAGLKAGQLIEEVNKNRVHNLTELKKVLDESRNGDQVLLRIRAGEYSQYVVLQAK